MKGKKSTTVSRVSKNPTVARVEKSESTSPLPPSAAEQLNKVKLIFVMNGYDVSDLNPQPREFMGAGYSKPDRYISPIEFSVNGVEIGLYGSIVTIDGKPTHGNYNVYDVPQTYRFIANIIKNRSPVKEKPVKKAITKQLTEIARYLSVCLGG